MLILQIRRDALAEKRQDEGQIVPGDGVDQRGVMARASTRMDQLIIVCRFLRLTKTLQRARRFDAQQAREFAGACFRERLGIGERVANGCGGRLTRCQLGEAREMAGPFLALSGANRAEVSGMRIELIC